jgi:photosystem II stability/assembly factor-like uncharacterized protein
MMMRQRLIQRSLNFVIRLSLFMLLLALGVTIALLMGETSGHAFTDLSNAPVRTMATSASNEIMYAALNNGPQPAGFYRSDDQGRTWQLAGPGPDTEINVLAVHPMNKAVLFAGSAGGPVTQTNNLWRSNDGGQTWRKFFLSLPAHPDGLIPDVTALAVDPYQPEVLYVGTAGQGVYRFDVGPDGYGYSLVGGVSFHQMNIKSLGVGPDSWVYALTDHDLFGSQDGQNWQKLALPPELPLKLAVAGTNPQALYVITPAAKVYRSLNQGQSWEYIGGDWWTVPEATVTGTALAVDPQNSDHVVIATAYGLEAGLVGGGIYETYEAGRNWAKVADAHDVITDLIIDEETIYAAARSGLVKYGQAEAAESSNLLASLRAITNLSMVQLLILTLTIGLAGLILLGRIEWIQRLQL